MTARKKTTPTTVATRTALLADFTPDPANLNKGTERGRQMVGSSLEQYGAGRSILLDRDGVIIAGNKTAEQAGLHGMENVLVVQTDGTQLVAVQRMDLALSDPETRDRAQGLAIADNRAGELGLAWDAEAIAALANGVNLNDFWSEEELSALAEAAVEEDARAAADNAATELRDRAPAPDTEEPPPPEEVPTRCKPGDVWQLGRHRLAVGDCTDTAVVAALMVGEKAVLLHADPPYGMGKEADGIANDNLYAEKLDAFQSRWWRTARPHLMDNASVYVWGNAEDLWRWWYRGGLRDSERMTLRNEVVWRKPSVQGMSLEGIRSYPPASERCLFWMLGEQGFNNNADNYWEGWEGIRSALAADCEAMGWGPEDIKRICGVGMYGHWFSKSQWVFIPEEHYKKLQAAARGEAFKRGHDAFRRDHDAFKRDHDELKREWYATRAYFDNTHDAMTDVWDSPSVQGAERYGHATPKPIAIAMRCVASSCPPGGLTYEPFLGSGTTLLACERLGRVCYGAEIEPKYGDIILARWEQETGDVARRSE
jgi:DNA modification methylase